MAYAAADMTPEALFERYLTAGIESAGCLLLDWHTACRFLEDVRVEGLALWGIEGYWLRQGTIEPSMDNSIYFRGDIRLGALPGVDAFEKAEAWLAERRDPGLFFDFDICRD